MALRGLAIATMAAAGCVLPPTTGVLAAVKHCQNSQSSGIVRAPTELAGKRLALKKWSDRARTFGGTYTNWSLASHKLVKCVRVRTGGYECIAVGAPCVIKQVPPRRRFNPKAPIEI